MKKKIFAIAATVLAAVLALAAAIPPISAKGLTESPSFGAYKHVFIIGVDGAGQFFRDADTPEFDRIFASGAVDYSVRVEIPTDSGPNWGSILTGVSYFKHLIHNGNSGETQRTKDTKYPSVFAVIRQARPDAVLAPFVNWNNVNYGMVETDIGVNEMNVTDDAALTDKICEYLDAGSKPALLFVQLDSVDHAGHTYGSASEEYMDAIAAADGYVGRIYDAVVRNGLAEDSLFIVTADHGHKKTGGHGRFSKRETLTTVAAVGKTVVQSDTLGSTARARDIAAITLFALGVDRPAQMSARIPPHLFAETKGEARSFYKDPLDGLLSPVMWLVTMVIPG